MTHHPEHELEVLAEALDEFPLPERDQTLGEEIANSVTHGLGLLAALAAIPCLIVHMVHFGNVRAVVGASIFSATVILLYLSSTLYHALTKGRAKQVFNVIEHGAIFVLIAGTYTPVTLSILRGTLGWVLFGTVWALAILGVTLKSIGGLKHPILSTGLYVGMGWVVVLAIRPLWITLPPYGFWGIVAGGLAYTLGVPFYAAQWRYSHAIWHLFVIMGTAAHFVTIYYYAV